MPATKIIAYEQVGDRVVRHVAAGDTFEEAMATLRQIREYLPGCVKSNAPAGATMYRGLGGLTEPQ